ncbi:RND family efflux transporter, MFP subunit [Fodinibius roseus]|uniref:RND family efflux transporter, MFP subunit n=1 Tax=Fodinibius roseus TaxID=1194090 RepID=A0A1M5FIN3_9BACT|nr:efflux RND transporter periplasmic adaptor subunit [Fodinibius roseus]SHF91437.1 RND family efflux transporter, MFP subunit [Fodinibius roseus]
MILQSFISEYRNLLKELWDTYTGIQNEQKLSRVSEQKPEMSNQLNNRQKYYWKARKETILPVVLVGLMALLSACSSSSSQPQAPPPPTVSVSTPLEEEITRYDEFTGRFRAIERVEVRARINGYLDEIRFTDGEMVEKGEVLFVIDQRPYRIALEQAHADLDNARTRFELAKKELERAQDLRSTGAVSQELIDRRNQEYLSAEAAVSSAEASVHSAELDLEYTEVKAPVSGKISENFVSTGNLVSGGLSSATLLTRIVSLDPIYFTFEASEDKLIRYMKGGSFKGNVTTTRESFQTVKARLLGEEQFTYEGNLDFIDNEIDHSTGTLRVRAVFPNNDLLLTPGMFAKARFSATGRHRELLVPDKAIGSDQAQRYVLTVDDSSKVSRKFVKTGTLHNDLRIIEEGLSKKDRVIVNGLGKVQPGQKVTANQDNIALAEEEHQQ